MSATRRVVIVVTDLLFATRISETAKGLGVQVESVSPDEVAARCAADPPAAVVLDLEAAGEVLAALRALKAGTATRAIPVIGFYPHVRNSLRVSAQAAGADMVLPRSAFAARLARLLVGELGSPA